MKRKVQALLLSFVLLLQLSPVFTVGASAAGAVTYNRETPPAGIFNAINGSDDNFYNAYTSTFTDFNLVSKFGLSYSSKVNFSQSYKWAWQWGQTVDTVYKIANSGGLYINTSGTFNNDWHTHGSGPLHLFAQSVLSYTSMQLYGENTVLQNYSGMKFSSSRSPSMRLGIGSWAAVGAHWSFQLVTYEPDIIYNEGKDTCSCHTGSVSCVAVALKDALGPTIKNVTLSSQKVKPGDTVTIRVQYSEPIRFADDSANHGDAAITLRLDNHDATAYRTASLTGLEDDTLVFSFKVPNTDNGAEYSVSKLDLSPLIQETKLKLVSDGGSFDSVTNFKGDGYTTAKALVTDLAGNPISQSSCTITTLRVDGVAPTVASVTQQAVTNNANVKAALGKTDMSPTDTDYTDYSDTHLGAGDSVTFTANFSEALDLKAGNYTAATATTNLKKSKSSEFVTVSSASLTTVAATTSDPAYSALTFAPVAIEPGMTCADGGGKIEITGITLTASDLCGNAYTDKTLSVENVNPKLLDVDGPTVSTGITPTGGKYSPEAEGSGFVFPFTVQSNNAYQIASINGSFTLESSDGAGAGAEFEYTMTNSAEVPIGGWTRGKIGAACDFEQFADQRYLHIRPVAGATYDLADPNLVFKPEDYAGNIGGTTFPLSWKLDNVAPTASAGTPVRTLTNAATRTGTLTVPVTVTDHSGLKSIKYAWGDAAPTTESGWTDSTATLTEPTVTANASAAVSSANFSQHLWIKTADKYDNTLTKDMGVFSYDLSLVAYTLTPNSNYASAPSLVLGSLASGGAAAALLKVPGDTNADNYYVHYMAADGDFFPRSGAIDDFWIYMSVTKNVSTGVYTFTQQTPADAVKTEFYSIAQYKYTGKLTIETITGLSSAFSTASYTNGGSTLTAPDSAGINQTPVSAADTTLIVAKSGDMVYSAGFTLPDAVKRTLPMNGEFSPADSDAYLPSTLAGVPVKMTVANNIAPELGISELDLKNSKLYVYRDNDFNNPAATVALDNATIIGNTLTVTLPAAEYATGAYCFKVELSRPNGTDSLFDGTYSGASHNYNYYIIDASDAGTAVISGTLIDNLNLYDYGAEEETLYTPANGADTFYYPASNTANNENEPQRLTFTLAGMTSVNAQNVSGSLVGQRAVRVWNVTAGETEASESAAWQIFSDYYSTKVNNKFYYFKSAFDITYVANKTEAAAAGRDTIPMYAGQENVIAVQTMCDNGRLSSVVCYTVYPDNAQVKGAFSTTRDGSADHVFDSGELVFTPAQGQSMTGVKVYFSTASGPKERKELTEAMDGTYRCELPTGTEPSAPAFRLCTVDAHDNYTLFAFNAFTGMTTTKLLDSGAPTVTAGAVKTNADGTYTADYIVTDETNMDYKPLTFQLGFDANYLNMLGLSEGSTYTVSLAKDTSWTLPAGDFNAFGITGVSVVSTDGDGIYPRTLTETKVTVTGVAKYNTASGAAASYTITPSLSAADIFGKTSAAVSDGAVTVTNAKPAATDWKLVNDTTGGYGSRMSLKADFNQPVAIGKSWICQSPTGFSTSKTNEIPLTNDGDHSIAFYDVFGTLWQQSVTLTDVFGDYGFELSFSNAANTADPVTVTATAQGSGIEAKYLQFYSGVPDAEGKYSTSLGERAYQPQYVCKANGDIVIKHYQDYHTNTADNYTVVHIANIVNGAPTARLHYSFEDTAIVYNGSDPLPNTTTGSVKVWYTTERTVTPTNEAVHVFDAAGTYTFTYKDEFGNAGSVTADLSTVTFQGKYTPPPDTNPPQLAVSIETKRSGSYAGAENFGVSGTVVNGGSQTNTIYAALSKMGYVQAYNFVVTATDDSECRLVVLKTAPTGATMDYSAAGDTITGVTADGRNVYVNNTVAADFTVAVVDSAGNYSAFTIPKAPLKFDNTAPTLTVEWEYKTLYDKAAYLSVTDKTDDGSDSGASATLTAPGFAVAVGGNHDGQYYYEFTANASRQVILTDAAGNTTQQKVSVTDLDDSAPTLTVEWTPCYVYGSGLAERGSPTAGPVNSDVTAFVKSSKPIASYTAKYQTYDGNNWSDPSDTWSGAAADKPVIAISDADKSVLKVVFPASGVILKLTLTAANGQSADETLILQPEVIDKTTLDVAYVLADVIRTGYSVPYAEDITLSPNKDAYSTDGTGTAGTLYNVGNPLTARVYSDGTYRYRFTDKAGSSVTKSVTVTGIDNTAPTITTTPGDTSELPSTSGSTSVTVTLNEAGTIAQGGHTYKTDGSNSYTLSFDKNGSYSVAAYDLAGNVSFVRIGIGNIDSDAPTIIFGVPTVKLVQGSTQDTLNAQLSAGYTASDGAGNPAPAVAFDSMAVDLETPGLYQVNYTVTDAAGNVTETVRWVQVYDKNLPLVTVDGTRADPDGTVQLKNIAAHKLTVGNLAGSEPYSVYLRKGLWSAGQMKGASNALTVDASGAFAMTGTGYFTLYIVTQSRQTFRALLYVEK